MPHRFHGVAQLAPQRLDDTTAGGMLVKHALVLGAVRRQEQVERLGDVAVLEVARSAPALSDDILQPRDHGLEALQDPGAGLTLARIGAEKVARALSLGLVRPAHDQILAALGAVDLHDALLAAALGADEGPLRGTEALPFPLVAQDAFHGGGSGGTVILAQATAARCAGHGPGGPGADGRACAPGGSTRPGTPWRRRSRGRRARRDGTPAGDPGRARTLGTTRTTRAAFRGRGSPRRPFSARAASPGSG